jgi:hypothetical protein
MNVNATGCRCAVTLSDCSTNGSLADAFLIRIASGALEEAWIAFDAVLSVR